MSYDPPPTDPSPFDSPPAASPRPPEAYAEPGFPPPAHVVTPPVERPTLVTAAGMTMIVVGALFGLLGLFVVLAAVLFGSVGGSVPHETGVASGVMGMAAGVL